MAWIDDTINCKVNSPTVLCLFTSKLTLYYSYRRKLKAAKAMKSASMVTSDQKSGPMVPGTNKYTMEGSEDITINQPYKLKQIFNIFLTLCVVCAQGKSCSQPQHRHSHGLGFERGKLGCGQSQVKKSTPYLHLLMLNRSSLTQWWLTQREGLSDKLGTFPGEHFVPVCARPPALMGNWLPVPTDSN